MEVVVAYASAFGSTKGIAGEIGDRVRAYGDRATVLPVEEIHDLAGCDAVVLGSAVHNMRWLPQADAFAWDHRMELAARPTWLFSVGSVGDSNSFFGPRVAAAMRRMRSEPKGVAELATAIGARGHRGFAGQVERAHWGRSGNLFLRALGGTFGDHRDWPDIDVWADGIARQLRIDELVHPASDPTHEQLQRG